MLKIKSKIEENIEMDSFFLVFWNYLIEHCP